MAKGDPAPGCVSNHEASYRGGRASPEDSMELTVGPAFQAEGVRAKVWGGKELGVFGKQKEAWGAAAQGVLASMIQEDWRMVWSTREVQQGLDSWSASLLPEAF